MSNLPTQGAERFDLARSCYRVGMARSRPWRRRRRRRWPRGDPEPLRGAALDWRPMASPSTSRSQGTIS